MTILRHGWISDYSAQGMEGEIWQIFQDRAYAQDRAQGWRPEGMHRLESGDRLTIFDDEGVVLWAGRLAARRRNWYSHRKLFPGDPAWHPTGVAAETWQGWFQQKPALSATLERER